jgi:multidrug resistance efflux pump
VNSFILTAEFKPFQEVDVMAKVSGYVKEIRVDVGDRVKEGDLLATLEVPEMADDLRKSQAGVRHSQSEVARAQDEIARAKSAHDIAHLSYNRQANWRQPYQGGPSAGEHTGFNHCAIGGSSWQVDDL